MIEVLTLGSGISVIGSISDDNTEYFFVDYPMLFNISVNEKEEAEISFAPLNLHLEDRVTTAKNVPIAKTLILMHGEARSKLQEVYKQRVAADKQELVGSTFVPETKEVE